MSLHEVLSASAKGLDEDCLLYVTRDLPAMRRVLSFLEREARDLSLTRVLRDLACDWPYLILRFLHLRYSLPALFRRSCYDKHPHPLKRTLHTVIYFSDAGGGHRRMGTEAHGASVWRLP